MGYKNRNEVAREFGVTPQAIGKRLKTSGLVNRCTKAGRRLMIPDEVIEELRSYYISVSNKTETSETYETKTETSETKNTGKTYETETKTETSETYETKTETSETYETKTETSETKNNYVPWEVYEDLRQQLNIKDKQIEKLNEALLNAQEQGKAAQLLQAVDKKDALLTSGDIELENVPKGRWQRLKAAWRG
jgi:hypothetical protein